MNFVSQRKKKLSKHGTGGKTTMKFKKDGIVYKSSVDAVNVFSSEIARYLGMAKRRELNSRTISVRV